MKNHFKESAMSPNLRSKEQVDEEMRALIGRAKKCGALAYATLEISLSIQYRFHDYMAAERERTLQAVRTLPDSDSEKQERIARLTEMIESYVGYQAELEGVLAMFNDIERDVYPTDWRARPTWSRRYSYEGHLCHNLSRKLAIIQMWQKENGDQPLTEQHVREKILRYNPDLARCIQQNESPA